MKKILLSLITVAAVSAVAFGASQAFFSDTETSEGNILQAGALDLKIDNTCYYNNQACIEGFWGGQPNGDPATNTCSCTWKLSDLDESHVLFDLTDLKPGDREEDTLSLHVDNNSWMCVDIKTTANDDNSCTEPELEDDPTCTDPGAPGNADAFDGELAQNLNFVFWADDGDNVFEEGERESILTQGPASDVLDGVRWALADSQTGEPIPGVGEGEVSAYIGKFFCFGDIAEAPVADGDNDPTVASGFTCNGELVNNASQTDKLTGDFVFEAVQARNNDNFLCNPPATPTLTPTPTGTE